MIRRMFEIAIGVCLGAYLWPEPEPSAPRLTAEVRESVRSELRKPAQEIKSQETLTAAVPSVQPSEPKKFDALIAKMTLAQIRAQVSARSEKIYERFTTQFDPMVGNYLESWMKDAEAASVVNLDYPAEAMFEYELHGQKKRVKLIRRLDPAAEDVEMSEDTRRIVACSQSLKMIWQTLDEKTLEVTDSYEQDAATCGMVLRLHGNSWVEGWVPDQTIKPYGHFYAIEMVIGYGEGGFSIVTDEDAEPLMGKLQWTRLATVQEN